MAGLIREDDDVVAEINVTPFVDVVLVLLVVLMVTSTAIVQAAMKVDLPSAASAGDSVPRTFNVVVTDDGELFLDGTRVQVEEIANAFRRAKKVDSEVLAVIAADRSVDYGRVIEVIDIVKLNGATGFALNLEKGVGDD
ncbi:MAG: biopolymer transporter ExbD [Myxococcota bacterium]